MDQLIFLEADTPAELYGKAKSEDGQMLSIKEVMELRTQAAEQAVAVLLSEGIEVGNLPLYLSLALRECPIWKERLTTNTHMIRVENGYQFVECKIDDLDFERIIDGGVRYPSLEGGRFLDEATYDANPGGTYPVMKWARHPVLSAGVGDNDALHAYSTVVFALSSARFNSPGKKSIWCPQALERGTGRAWALGMGADAAYPPNNTTRGHWTVLKK